MSPITTHVLNTASGKPAAGLRILVSKKKKGSSGVDFEFERVCEAITNHDGRVQGLLPESLSLESGDVFEFHFCTKDYFEGQEQKCFYPYVKIVFAIEDTSSHYHVPLLISNYGYSTYRGS